MRHIKGYKSMFKERLLSALDRSNQSSRNVNNFDNDRITKIRNDFNKLRDRFLKPKIKEIRKSFYEIEKPENLSESKIYEIKQNLIKLEKNLNKYYDYDDIEYRGIRDVENLLNQLTDDDYYKPIKTKGAFNGNYIEYESRGDKNKKLSVKEYLCMIIPYLRDMINDHKTEIKIN